MRSFAQEQRPQVTAIERSIIYALAEGFQSKEIAQQISRSKPTVEGYIRVLYLKFNARSRAHLVAQAFRLGLIEEEA